MAEESLAMRNSPATLINQVGLRVGDLNAISAGTTVLSPMTRKPTSAPYVRKYGGVGYKFDLCNWTPVSVQSRKKRMPV